MAAVVPMGFAESCGANLWDAMAPSPLAARSHHSAVWSGTEVLVWGGEGGSGPEGDGARYDPDTDSWTVMSVSGAPSARSAHSAVWTGERMIVWAGEGGGGFTNSGASYDPVSDTWSPLSASGAPSPRSGQTAIWTGSKMIVWGGEDASGVLGNGGAYDPSTDTWSPLSASGAPSARHHHSAVWTGSEMIVWGGDDSNGVLGDGSRYDPVANTWTLLSSTEAPAARKDHSAVWTGSAMIVWGGADLSGRMTFGRSYDPGTDTWSLIGAAGELSPRSRHSAVWSGYEMLVWGGEDDLGPLDSGARYEPGGDSWTPMDGAAAPSARFFHRSLWTGSRMLVWGGEGSSGLLADGGGYCACLGPPAADDASCNDSDDDCDGSIDEDFVSESTSCGVGACSSSGSMECVAGVVEDSCEPGLPAADDVTCDGADDDCDGSMDEDFTPESTSCGLGECTASGSTSCSEGTESDSCVPGNPVAEICRDGLDNDCDGSTDEDSGTRYVADDGSDLNNSCLDVNAPCLSINHAVQVACDGETVSVAEGNYNEDVLIDHPVTVDGSGAPTKTILRGTGTVDVVRILSSDVHWTAVNIYDTPGVACMHIGNPAHPNLRGIKVDNTSLAGCAIGGIWDSTGYPGAGGAWNHFLAASGRDNVYDGSVDSGTGMLLINGNGKLEFKVGHLTNNDGPGLVIRPAADGLENRQIVFAGEVIGNNGNHPDVSSHTAIEIHEASEIRFEGNDFNGINGEALLLDQVDSGAFYCNKVRDNGDGLLLRGGSTIEFAENHFTNNSGTAVRVEAGTGPGLEIGYSYFDGNGTAIEHLGDGTLSAPRNWWGASDGPGGSGGGSGDSLSGSIASTDPFVAAPYFVRRPADSGWDPSASTCFQKVQPAIDQAADGDWLLIGPGTYKEHVSFSKPLNLEGIPADTGCSAAKISGEQSGSDLPVMKISDTHDVTLKQLSLESAGEGVTCGENTGDEIGLDLENVSDSTFSELCLRENGVTELRVFGNSNNNLFEDLTVDGMIRDFGGSDLCGHRSKTGILIDGGPSCEGGPGALPSGNRILSSTISYTTRGIVVRLAQNTEIEANTISASPAAAWSGETPTGVLVAYSLQTSLTNNQIEGVETEHGVRVAGKQTADCVSERSDSQGVTITGGTIRDATGAGIRLYRGASDPGRPLGVSISCLQLSGNGIDLEVDDAGGTGADASQIYHADLDGGGDGIVNHDSTTFVATGNWWDAADGPSGSGSGSGTTATGAVSFEDWLASSSSDDADADGFSECADDCDDSEESIYPGAEDICLDGIDNDCDGTIDQGAAAPTGIASIALQRGSGVVTISWSAVPDASGYDVVRGNLVALHDAGGDLGSSLDSCLVSQTSALSVDDANYESLTGLWYLQRARSCGGLGTYDSSDGASGEGRDAEVETNPAACP